MEVRILDERDISRLGGYMSTGIHPKNYIIAGCYDDYEPMGIAVVDNDEDVASIEWLYVGERYRNRGAAKAITGFLREWAAENEKVLTCRFGDDRILTHIFLQNGFELSMDYVDTYDLEIEEIKKGFGKSGLDLKNREGFEELSLSGASEMQLRKLRMDIEDSGTDFDEYRLLEADYDFSRIILNDGLITALLMIRRVTSETAEIALMWSKENSIRALMAMFEGAMEYAQKKASSVRRVSFAALEPSVSEFVKKTVGEETTEKKKIIEAVAYY